MPTTITDGTDVSTVVRTNLIQDPRATNPAGWTVGGLGTVDPPTFTEVAVTGATDGPVLPDGTQATTYMRYTLSGPTAAGGAYFLTNQVSGGNYMGDFPAGLGVGTAMYMRTSVAGSWYCRRWSYLAGASASSQQADPVVVPANTWVRLDHFAYLAADADYFRASVLASGPLAGGQVVEVTCAMVTPDVTFAGEWFDGNTPSDGDLSYRFTGAANASTSEEILTVPNAATPDLVLDYASEREARTIIHTVLDRPDPDVTLRPIGLRAGQLVMLCGTRELATAVELMHSNPPRKLTLTSDDEPTANMSYVPTGSQRTEYDADNDVWTVRASYQEVAS